MVISRRDFVLLSTLSNTRLLTLELVITGIPVAALSWRAQQEIVRSIGAHAGAPRVASDVDYDISP
jgi:phospholipid N-methyltransferase